MSADSFITFAYGSNMLTSRLRRRCPSAMPLGVATLIGYELRWHKKSKDGGFIRLLTSSMNPLKFDYSQFNKNFESVGEFKGLNTSDLEGEGIANIKAGASIISRFNK